MAFLLSHLEFIHLFVILFIVNLPYCESEVTNFCSVSGILSDYYSIVNQVMLDPIADLNFQITWLRGLAMMSTV